MNVELDEYEVANLWAALEVIATCSAVGPMNSGDWVRQVQYKLDAFTQGERALRPNASPEETEKRLSKVPVFAQLELIRQVLAVGDPAEYHSALLRLQAELREQAKL